MVCGLKKNKLSGVGVDPWKHKETSDMFILSRKSPMKSWILEEEIFKRLGEEIHRIVLRAACTLNRKRRTNWIRFVIDFLFKAHHAPEVSKCRLWHKRRVRLVWNLKCVVGTPTILRVDAASHVASPQSSDETKKSRLPIDI